MNERSQFKSTEATRNASDQLLKMIAENAGKPTIILLTGIGGVGKSLLLNQLKDKISEVGGNLIDAWNLMRHEKGEFYESKEVMTAFHDPKANKVLVSAVSIRERKLILERQEKFLPGWKIDTCVLKGMDRTEIKEYMNARSGIKLSANLLVDLSLGIPLLADQLIALDLNEEQALRFSFLYLIEHGSWTNDLNRAREMVNQYLSLEPSDSYLHTFCGKPETRYYSDTHWFGDSKRIYDNLNQFMMSKQKGDRQITIRPIFVASESETMYNSMLTNPGPAWIEIYAPSMTDDQAIAAYDVLGIDHENWCGAISAGISHTDKDPLLAYGASYRKVSFHIRDGHGHETNWLNEAEDLDIIAHFLHSQITDGKIPIPAGNSKGHRLLIDSHDHYDSPRNPIMVGWAVETLFQNLGISYLANNFVFGKQYVYNAETKSIKELGEAKRVDILELKYPKYKKKKRR